MKTTHARWIAAALLLAVSLFAGGSSAGVTRGLTLQERAAVVADLYQLAEYYEVLGDGFMLRPEPERQRFLGLADGLRIAAKYLEGYGETPPPWYPPVQTEQQRQLREQRRQDALNILRGLEP